ncbi:MAG: hypothetical protein D6711_00440 [Chloroflexi bacterium]|nr:MAG: hypothetical protein D6711_00440 [Chloroflexota bacterium]
MKQEPMNWNQILIFLHVIAFIIFATAVVSNTGSAVVALVFLWVPLMFLHMYFYHKKQHIRQLQDAYEAGIQEGMRLAEVDYYEKPKRLEDMLENLSYQEEEPLFKQD